MYIYIYIYIYPLPGPPPRGPAGEGRAGVEDRRVCVYIDRYRDI